jgi:hypothetical protein
MVWTAAGTVAATMIELQSFGYWAVGEDVCNPVGGLALSIKMNKAVTCVVEAALPLPAAGTGMVNGCPELIGVVGGMFPPATPILSPAQISAEPFH